MQAFFIERISLSDQKLNYIFSY